MFQKKDKTQMTYDDIYMMYSEPKNAEKFFYD